MPIKQFVPDDGDVIAQPPKTAGQLMAVALDAQAKLVYPDDSGSRALWIKEHFASEYDALHTKYAELKFRMDGLEK